MSESERICLSCGLRGRHGRDCPDISVAAAEQYEARRARAKAQRAR